MPFQLFSVCIPYFLLQLSLSISFILFVLSRGMLKRIAVNVHWNALVSIEGHWESQCILMAVQKASMYTNGCKMSFIFSMFLLTSGKKFMNNIQSHCCTDICNSQKSFSKWWTTTSQPCGNRGETSTTHCDQFVNYFADHICSDLNSRIGTHNWDVQEYSVCPVLWHVFQIVDRTFEGVRPPCVYLTLALPGGQWGDPLDWLDTIVNASLMEGMIQKS